MIQIKDWVMLAAIFGAMLISIIWPQAGAPFSLYPMVFMMTLLFLSFLSIPIESILQTARGYGLRLCGWLVLKLVILAIFSFAAGGLASLRQPLGDRLSIIIRFGIINNILVVVFSSEFFGPIEPLVALVYCVPFSARSSF